MIQTVQIDKISFKNQSKLKVRPDQEAYVCADLEKFVRSWAFDPQLDCYLAVEKDGSDERPVGFFAIDLSLERHDKFLVENSGVLRCFFVDEARQGQGIATKILAGVDQLMAKTYPGLKMLFLTVNLKNDPAIRLYSRAGFRIVGDPYLSGQAGPQNVMVKFLQPVENVGVDLVVG